MRSRDNARALLEHALRGLSLAAMIALAVRLWAGSAAVESPAIGSESLDSALAAWSVTPPARAVLGGATLPDARQRDWLVGLRRTGLDLAWRIADSPSVSLVVEPGPLPQAPSRVTALGTPGSFLVLTDRLGRIDSAGTGTEGAATWRVGSVGPVTATLGAARAVAQARDSSVAGPLLVIGQAGWESKFVIAALEEAGWSVAARLTVAPGAVVRQGSRAAIDTGAFSAVIVLDSSSTIDAGSLARFVNDGGGVVASGAGASHPALRTLLPRRAAAFPGAIGALLGPAPREGLSARTFTTAANAVVLERRGDDPVVVGRRVGAGRALVTGYDDTWRMRMAPPDESAPAAHRAWWSSLVSSVALSRLAERVAGPVDESPLAATVAALGPPLGAGGTSSSGSRVPWEALLALLAAGGLLAEWLSRRLRGVA